MLEISIVSLKLHYTSEIRITTRLAEHIEEAHWLVDRRADQVTDRQIQNKVGTRRLLNPTMASTMVQDVGDEQTVSQGGHGYGTDVKSGQAVPDHWQLDQIGVTHQRIVTVIACF